MSLMTASISLIKQEIRSPTKSEDVGVDGRGPGREKKIRK